MREMVGRDTTLKDIFLMIKEEQDNEYVLAYMSMIQSTLSPLSERKIQKRVSGFVKKKFHEMIKSGKTMAEINGTRLEGYKEEYIFALEEAVKWEMSPIGKIMRVFLGKEILRWDKEMTISEIRR